MQELAFLTNDPFIYILNPFHKIENLDVFEFFRANPKELMNGNAVFYTNFLKIKEIKFYKFTDIILFAIENNIKIFIDETDLVSEILELIINKNYKNIVCSLQGFDYINYDKLYYFDNIFIGRLNDVYSLKELSKTFLIDKTALEEINRNQYFFVKLK